jgi:hypothetical protein
MKTVIHSVTRKIVSPIRNAASFLSRLIGKFWLLPPCQRIDHAFNKAWKGTRPLEYRFLPYLTSVLRVLGWGVLVIGVIASILFGLQIMNSGLMIGTTELTGIRMGVAAILLGIIGSFLAWLFLLANRELVYLFIHVKENTRNTAQGITDESDQDRFLP